MGDTSGFVKGSKFKPNVTSSLASPQTHSGSQQPAARSPSAVIGGHRPSNSASQPASDAPAGSTSIPSQPGASATSVSPAVKIAAKNDAVLNAAARAKLAARPFSIKTLYWKNGDAGSLRETTGCILSQSLDQTILAGSSRQDASSLTLAALRKLIPSMSSFSRIEKFCTSDGTLITDERITLGEYFDLCPQPVSSTDSAQSSIADPGTPASDVDTTTATPAAATQPKTKQSDVSEMPTLYVYYRSALPAANKNAPDLSLAPKPTQDNMKELNISTAAAQAHELTSRIGELKAQVGQGSVISAGTLTEDQWTLVLSNCSVFYGWVLDKDTKSVSRAPKAAFRLRSMVEQDPVHAIPDQVTPPVNPNGSSQLNGGQPDADQGTQLISSSGGPSVPPASGPNTTSATAAQPASTAAVDPFAPVPPPIAISAADKVNDPYGPGGVSSTMNTTTSMLGGGYGYGGYGYGYGALPAGSTVINAVAPKTSQGIPNFRTNDDSRIEISVCKDSLAVSLARNDFSSQSTEASVAGGAFGVQVGVSGGYAKSQSKESTSQSDSSVQIMVARYMFPRCDLFLTPDDLEPTPELVALVDTIHKTKSLTALRKLQSEFGQFFCQQLTVGARLLSTKIMTSTTVSSTETQKEQFKVSVGVSVTSPYVSGSVKHDQEQGSATSNATTATRDTESNVFEACGGDTTLAVDPTQWAATVPYYQNWRVISRDALTTLIDMLASMPGYAPVQSWFVQAIPAMSRYIVLDEGRRFTGRFKIVTPTNSLTIQDNSDAIFYLGSDYKSISEPLLNYVTPQFTSSNFWDRIDALVDIPLFDPPSYRAPVIRGFSKYNIGDGQYGNSYNTEFKTVEWTIVAPFSQVLKHGSRVIIQTTSDDINVQPSHMVVFRNAQGVYLPGMSDRDEFQYWRLLKANAKNSGEPIKPGDNVRLCWVSKDQTTGMRDYVDDAFGRRQINCPPELSGKPLYLKVPWPRMEKTGINTNMVLSTSASMDNTTVTMQTKRGSTAYTLQDLTFRLDTVENGGKGDSDDYMLKDIHTGPTSRPGANPMAFWAKMFQLKLPF